MDTKGLQDEVLKMMENTLGDAKNMKEKVFNFAQDQMKDIKDPKQKKYMEQSLSSAMEGKLNKDEFIDTINGF